MATAVTMPKLGIVMIEGTVSKWLKEPGQQVQKGEPVIEIATDKITYEKMTDEAFLEEFFAMETWINDNIPVAGETFRQFVKYCFQQNLLVAGKFPVGGQKVNLAHITCPVLLLSGEADPFARLDLLRSTVAQLADARLITYPRLGHSLRPVLDDALDRIAEFAREVAPESV